MMDVGHFATTGVNMTGYYDEITQERKKFTINYRKGSYFQNVVHLKRNLAECKPKVLESNANLDILKPDSLADIFQAQTEEAISQFLSIFLSVAETSMNEVRKVICTQQFIEGLASLYSFNFSNSTTIQIYLVTALAFNNCRNIQCLVDSDIIGTLASQIYDVNPDLIFKQLELISSIASSSDYARDALFCFGIHTAMIDIFKGAEDSDLKTACCKCISSLFEVEAKIDTAVIQDFLPQVCELLSDAEVPQLEALFETLIEMTNEDPDAVFTIYNLKVFPTIVQAIPTPELTNVALSLCGNLTVSQPEQILSLIQLGLREQLFAQLNGKYAHLALWVLANMIECCPNEIMSSISPEFVSEIIGNCMEGTSEFKQEATYFVSSLVIFSAGSIQLFMQQEVIDLLSEMLGCGIYYVTLRCIDALTRLIDYCIKASQSEEIENLLRQSDFYDRLEDLNDCQNDEIQKRLAYLQKSVDNL